MRITAACKGKKKKQHYSWRGDGGRKTEKGANKQAGREKRKRREKKTTTRRRQLANMKEERRHDRQASMA